MLGYLGEKDVVIRLEKVVVDVIVEGKDVIYDFKFYCDDLIVVGM